MGEPDHLSRPLDLRMLRLFDVLYSTRSVTLAAERLGWSQPAVSTWLARLRLDLHDPLFVRTAKGMQPTPRAEQLIGKCRVVLASLAWMLEEEAGFDPLTARRTFRIAMTDASHVTLLPRLLSRTHAMAPEIRLETLRIGTETPGLLLSGEADLALGLLPQLEAGFYQQHLYTQDWVCLTRTGHPTLTVSETLLAYRNASHVGVASGASERLLEEALRLQGIVRKVRLELPGFLGLPFILSDTDLVATLPRMIGELLARIGDLAVVDCPATVPSFDIKQHWHERFHYDAGSRWLRGLCAELFQGPLNGHYPEP